MNFKPVKLTTGRFAVQQGRVKKSGAITYLKSSLCDSLEEAEKSAAYHKAKDLIYRAEALIADMELSDAKHVACLAYNISDTVVERAEKEDPEFDHYDPKGFLA